MVYKFMDTCSCQRFRYKGYTDIQRRQKIKDIEAQKKFTDNKGWKFVKDYAKEKKAQFTTKAKNVLGGVDVVVKKLKGKK